MKSQREIISVTKTGTVLLQVLAQPRASKNKIVGVHDCFLKVKLTSPPVEGAANKALLRLLSKTLKIPVGKMSIKKGNQGRKKVVEIIGSDVENIKKRLELR